MAEWFVWPDMPIRVTARGAWLHGEEPLHPRVQALFSRNIVPQADGHYRIQLGHARQEIVVDITPYFVRSATPVLVQGALAQVQLILSDETQETLDPRTLMQDEDNVLYCRIVRHQLSVPCQFSSAQYHALAAHMQMAEDQTRGMLILGTQAWPIASYDATPTPVNEGPQQ